MVDRGQGERPADVLDDGRPPGRQSRVPGWAVALAALAALLGIVRLTTDGSDGSDAPPPPTPTAEPAPVTPPSPGPPARGFGPPLDEFAGLVSAIAVAPRWLYAVQVDPPRLVASSADRSQRISRTTVRDPTGVAADPAAGRVWAWSVRPRGESATTVVWAYETPGLHPVARVRVAGYVQDAVAAGGRLWLAGAGLTAIGRDGEIRRVPGVRGQVVAVAADAGRHRVLAAGSPGIVAVGVDDLRVTARFPLRLAKPSIAVVGPDVWIGDFGTDTPHLRHFPAADAGADGAVGQAADSLSVGGVVWAGGTVLWVRDGGSATVTCVDPGTGEVLGEWQNLNGPVVSRPGAAYGLGGGGVLPLELPPGCRG